MINDDKIPILLLVDDDPNDQELAVIALESTYIPHQLLMKRDGAEVLQWVDEVNQRAGQKEWPRLILLDLKLPKVNGLEVLEKLRSHSATRNIPVVVFTSSLEEKDLIRSYDEGANAYIRKPIDFVEYQRTVCDMARFWMTHNQVPPRQGESEGVA